MTERQPEALRLADALEDDLTGYDGLSIPGFCQNIANEAAAELRRLHQSETEGWRYADELEQERKRLSLQNQELLEALQYLMVASGEQLTSAFEQAQEIIAKATGEPND